MTRDEVREAVGSSSEAFRRTSASEVADYFRANGIFAYYTGRGELEALEFSEPQGVKVGHLMLSTTPFKELLQAILSLDPEAEIEEDGFISRRLGCGIWSEGESSQPPQSVIAFTPGYYD